MGLIMMHFAGIDVGSHTTRLLIVSVEKDTIRPVCNLRTITGMAKGFDKTNRLSEEGKEKTYKTLEYYKKIMNDYKVEHCKCGATGIFRVARDSSDFLSKVSKAIGFECEILSEEREALISFSGTISFLKDYTEGKFALLFDLGGSTTEFIFSKGDQPISWKSVPIGATTITDLFFKKAPADKKDIEKAISFVDKKLKENLVDIKLLSEAKNSPVLIGSAGTVSTLGAIKMKMTKYEPYKICGLTLTKSWIADTLDEILKKSIAERAQIPGLEKGREDIIAGGSLVVDRIVNFFGQNELIVSDAGLLEGLALSAATETLQIGLTWQF